MKTAPGRRFALMTMGLGVVAGAASGAIALLSVRDIQGMPVDHSEV